MTRKLQPFKRADGVLELAILGNFGMAHMYNSTEKVSHFVEDTDVDTDTVHPNTYYIQFDGHSKFEEYKPKGVHLLRNIEFNGDTATCEDFSVNNNRDDQDDWIEREYPASDFEHLNNREMLIPMKPVKD